MDRNAIKIFAIESRRQLIESVKYQASLMGVTSDSIDEPVSKAEGMETYDYGAGTYTLFDDDIHKRESFVKEVNIKGYDNVVEEVAYTWFNRIIAIRFMEVNDYLPTRTRVLSSDTPGKTEPDIISEALELDLDFNSEDNDLILKLKDENKLDEIFRFLFIKQCNKLNEVLPGLFKKTDDWMELLLNIDFTNQEDIIRKLITDIPENDFKEQVEIIGWLYQYYITDLNNLIYNGSYKKEKISKEMLPFATQIFTPDWVVKYMVENSLGKLWLESSQDLNLKNNFKYYIENNNSCPTNTNFDGNIKNIKVIDPCMGSGHILVYVFDVLMQIYKTGGYTEKDAAIAILENNIYGLDIDDRAHQLAYFAIMMKARQYNRKLFDKNIKVNLFSISESNNIDGNLINKIIEKNPEISNDLNYLVKKFYDAKEYGSILKVKSLDYNKLINVIDNFIEENRDNLLFFKYENDLFSLKEIINQSNLLNLKYDVVVTNPPYLNSSRFNSKLINFSKKYYDDVKADLSMMIYKNAIESFSKPNGYISFITTNSWMFLIKFEKFRAHILDSIMFESIVDFGSELFEGKVGHNLIVAWVNKNMKPTLNHESIAIKLIDYNYSNREMKKTEFFNEKNRYCFNQQRINKIPGHPLAYWVNDNVINSFDNKNLGVLGNTLKGTVTADNDRFLKFFWEIDYNKLNDKWIPCAKGGEFKKYYGNIERVIDWSEEARSFYKNNHSSSVTPNKFCFKEGITFNSISSKGTGFRYLSKHALFCAGGPTIINLDNIWHYIGLLNSKVVNFYLDVLNPTINLPIYVINSLPVIFNKNYEEEIEKLTYENVCISKSNWDSYETSLDFKKHPFIKFNNNSIQDSFKEWENESILDFNKIKNNEIRLNELFIKIYGFDFLNVNVLDEEITIEKANYEQDIKLFISYAVGCIFGRYSLDDEGIIFAGGTFDLNNYHKFNPDDDNIIPVLDREYFNDDIVGRFIEFIKVCFGDEHLEENIDFIANALNKKGKTSREIIRNYFLNDFFKNHTKQYSKCPIYWQFDSGKQNAFKCLVYMHRYDSSIIARVRTDYLHKTQKAIELNLAHCDNIIDNSSNKSEISKAAKDKTKYIKQLDEIKVYDEALRHMATQNIEIDLDDGVKVNYVKFQNVEVSIEGEKTKKIDLLKKIR